jgi:cytochrome c oxidase subunit 1
VSDYLTCERTVMSWIWTHDHKRVGVLFLIGVTISLFLGGVFALLLRTEHFTPGPTIMDPLTYNRFFTLHGVIMVWLFLIPSIPSGFGNFLVPLMIGARDVAFPRLNILSFWLYALGAVTAIGGMVVGGADTGWTFYVPYSAETATAVTPILIGVFIVGWSSIITGANFIATIHTMRAEGVTWMRMPLFVWTIYGTSVILLLATPVLAITLTLIAFDNVFHWGMFDPSRGGDPVLFEHLFWFYSHPAVYIMILPAMGVISETVCAYCRKNMMSYTAIVVSTVGIALVGFFTWGHHMFTAGMSAFDAGAFGILSMFVAIFSAIKVFNWVGTFYQGSIRLDAPMLYVLSFLFLFVFGGMTGVAVATMSLDVHWHDTYFVVAHFHFIMVGASMTAFLGALHYWFPKITGRLLPRRLSQLAAVGIFVGFCVTFIPQFLLGNGGMPRRYYYYAPKYQALHVTSTIGAYILGGTLLLILTYTLWSLRYGRRATANPFASASFEWRTPSPPPRENFLEQPVFVRGAYDYTYDDEEQRPEEEAPSHA